MIGQMSLPLEQIKWTPKPGASRLAMGDLEYPFKTRPFLHQLDCWRASKEREAFALLMEMGCGKTWVVINTASYLYDRGAIDSLVVFAPKGVYRNWQDAELPAHMPDHVRYRVAAWSSAPNKADDRAMELLCHRDAMSSMRVLLVNVEAMSTKRAFEFTEKFMTGCRPLLVLDESTTIKHEKSKRTEALLWLAKFAKYRRIMTGSAADNSPFDLYSQYDFLDPTILGFSSFYSFRNHFAKCVTPQDFKRLERVKGWRTMSGEQLERMGFDRDVVAAIRRGTGRNYVAVLEYRNTDELNRLIAPHSFIVKKDDCLDLPPKLYQTRDVEMNAAQREAYQQMRQQCVIEVERALAAREERAVEAQAAAITFDELMAASERGSEERVETEVERCRCESEAGAVLSPVCPVCGLPTPERTASLSTAKIVITQLLRLHQVVCGFVKTDDGREVDLGETNPRIEELLQTLEGHGGKAIVWANYRRSIRQVADALAKAYGPESVVTYYGETKPEDRRAAIKAFQDPQSPVRWFVANRSGAFGLTLTAADLVVFYSNDYDREVRGQAEDRAHRIGQDKSVLYVDLVCRGTADEKILKALRDKKRLADSITASNWKEWLR